MNRRKPILTLLTFALACAAPYFIPGMERFRFVRAEQLRRVFVDAWTGDIFARMFPPLPVKTPPPPATVARKTSPGVVVKREPKDEATADIPEPAPVSIEGVAALRSFYAALDNTRAGRRVTDPHGITRIVHIGDSPLAADLISSEARVLLQKTFGDGGPGWHLPARPWEFYSHDRISLQAKGWKNLSPLLQSPGNKGDYGLQGIAFTASSPQAYSTLTGWRKNPPAFSRLEIYYQAKPGGGRFEVLADGATKKEISTAAEIRDLKVESLELEDGPHEITIRPAGNGEVTLFGVAMERDEPGVVYDSLGSVGASIHSMTLPNLDEWRESLRLRHPHLVILGLGTNESGYGYLATGQYEGDYRKIIDAIAAAVPGVSILIMAPMDRGMRGANGDIITMPAIPRLVDAQRRVALANHCAFFNTYQAMGGDGTMGRWYHGRPRLVGGDFTHPTGTGANRVGGWLVDALIEGFNAPPAESSPNSSPTQTQPEQIGRASCRERV